MAKRREWFTIDNGTVGVVPVGDHFANGTVLITPSDMDQLVKDYGELSFFCMNDRGPVCFRKQKANRVVARMILKADSRYRVSYADKNKFNLQRDNLILAEKKESKLQNVRPHNYVPEGHYIDPVAVGLIAANDDVSYGSFTAVGKPEPSGLNLNNDQKSKVIVDLFRRVFAAKDEAYRQKLCRGLWEAFESMYGKHPFQHPATFLKIAKRYDASLTMADLKAKYLLPA